MKSLTRFYKSEEGQRGYYYQDKPPYVSLALDYNLTDDKLPKPTFASRRGLPEEPSILGEGDRSKIDDVYYYDVWGFDNSGNSVLTRVDKSGWRIDAVQDLRKGGRMWDDEDFYWKPRREIRVAKPQRGVSERI